MYGSGDKCVQDPMTQRMSYNLKFTMYHTGMLFQQDLEPTRKA